MFWTLVVFNLGSPKAAPCLFAHKIVHLCQGTPVSFSNARNGESVYKDQSPQAEPGKRLRLVSKIQGASVDQDGFTSVYLSTFHCEWVGSTHRCIYFNSVQWSMLIQYIKNVSPAKQIDLTVLYL